MLLTIIIFNPSISNAGVFGSSNFWECIIDELSEAKNDAIVRAGINKCKSKFPKESDKIVEKKPGFFGPSTANECVLKYGKSVSNDLATRTIVKACIALYPANKSEKSKTDSEPLVLSSSPSKLTQQQTEEKLLEGFTKVAEQINAQGAVMVNQYIRLDKSVVGPGVRLTYFYSFPKYSSRDIERGWILANLQPEVRKNVCGSKEMKSSLQYGGTYVYSYIGSDGVEIARFELSKNDCDY